MASMRPISRLVDQLQWLDLAISPGEAALRASKHRIQRLPSVMPLAPTNSSLFGGDVIFSFDFHLNFPLEIEVKSLESDL